MSFYQLNFATLVAVNTGLAYRQYHQGRRQEVTANIGPEIEKSAGKEEIALFTKDFFTIYLLVVAADWLQVSIIVASNVRSNNQRVSRALIFMQYTDMRRGFRKPLSQRFTRRALSPERLVHPSLARWQTSMEGERHVLHIA
jgi:hypothetical protein